MSVYPGQPSEPKCEVCGQPAAVMVCDLRELESVKDEQGRLWAAWEIEEQHLFCHAHRRRPRRIWLVGTTQEYIRCVEQLEYEAAALGRAVAGLPPLERELP